MPDIDAFLLDPARNYYESCTAAEQSEIDRIIRNICTDPYIDLEVKLAFPFPPYTPVLYLGETFYLVYDFENNWTIAIWNIGRDDETLSVPAPPEHR